MSSAMINNYLERGNFILEDEPPCEKCRHDNGHDCDIPACDYSPKEEAMTNPATHPYTDMVDQMAKQPKRAQILDEVKKIICQDRQDVHGDPEQTHEVIADLWNVYTNQCSLTRGLDADCGFRINAQDVAVMMCLFKIARHAMNPNHKDNLVDLIGYAAIAAELGST